MKNVLLILFMSRMGPCSSGSSILAFSSLSPCVDDSCGAWGVEPYFRSLSVERYAKVIQRSCAELPVGCGPAGWVRLPDAAEAKPYLQPLICLSIQCTLNQVAWINICRAQKQRVPVLHGARNPVER